MAGPDALKALILGSLDLEGALTVQALSALLGKPIGDVRKCVLVMAAGGDLVGAGRAHGMVKWKSTRPPAAPPPAAPAPEPAKALPERALPPFKPERQLPMAVPMRRPPPAPPKSGVERVRPVTPAIARYAGWFAAARWPLDQVAWLFDVAEPDLAAALGRATA